MCSLVFPPTLNQSELCEAVWRLEALEDHVLLLSVSYGTGFRIQDSGFRMRDSGFRIQDSGFEIRDEEFRI